MNNKTIIELAFHIIWKKAHYDDFLLIMQLTFTILAHKWPNSNPVFLPTNKTFKGICLALVGKSCEFLLHLKPFSKKNSFELIH